MVHVESTTVQSNLENKVNDKTILPYIFNDLTEGLKPMRPPQPPKKPTF